MIAESSSENMEVLVVLAKTTAGSQNNNYIVPSSFLCAAYCSSQLHSFYFDNKLCDIVRVAFCKAFKFIGIDGKSQIFHLHCSHCCSWDYISECNILKIDLILPSLPDL